MHIIEQNHERELQRKDAILQMLDRDLEEAEDQYQIVLRSQLANIDAILGVHADRMRELENAFKSQLQRLQFDFHQQKEAVIAKFSAEKADLEAIIAAIEREEHERDAEVASVHSLCLGCMVMLLCNPFVACCVGEDGL